MTKNNHIPDILISKYAQDRCTEDERAIVESWYLQYLADSTYVPKEEDILAAQERISQKLLSGAEDSAATNLYFPLWKHVIRVACIAVAVISLCIYLDSGTAQKTPVRNKSVDILPGGNYANLTLGNGERITLGESSDLIIKQGIVVINQINKSTTIYSGNGREPHSTVWNTLTTPLGGNYQICLQDGTKVWLNAGSALTFPSQFDAKEQRVVKLKGEAYFEVQKDKSRPFKVISDKQVIEVLGTHFNISAYPLDEKITTTLVEGKIRVYNGKVSKIVNPGEESIINHSRLGNIHIGLADIEKNLAWKNNDFVFNGENLQSIMKIIARWYNVEIHYTNQIDDSKYWGMISRSRNISAVLNMLKATGKVSFKIQGRRIIVIN